MYILNITSDVINMLVNQLRDFIFESYYKRIGFVKERSYYSIKPLNKYCFVALHQTNIKKYLMVVMLKNTSSHL